MTEIESITDDAGYERAQVRIGQLFNNCANDERELTGMNRIGQDRVGIIP